MKKIATLIAIMVAGGVFALDNEAWLSRARECASSGTFMDFNETEEDGVYCLVLAVINSCAGKSADEQVGEAVLEAKRKITAFLKGEMISASRSVDTRSEEIVVDGEKTRESYKRFEKKITAKVNALIKGTKVLGQVTVNEKSYAVCFTCEKYEDQAAVLAAAQSQYAEEGVVFSVGEASSFDLATQKAIRGAVEQVLGTVVVGYDKMSTKSEFQSKVFSGADGVVEEYRVVSETEVAIGRRVEIVAKISTKTLLDNYSNYMKFLGDPEFFIVSNSPELSSHFAEFFSDMGIRVTESPQRASYLIECNGDYRKVSNPMNGRKGIQLSLRFKVKNAKTTEILIDFYNNPKKSACFQSGGEERQKEICSEKAFAQMKEPLHERIQQMVGKLVGRKMDEAAREE